MTRASVCMFIAFVLMIGSFVLAGNLTPPAGPVAPTMKRSMRSSRGSRST